MRLVLPAAGLLALVGISTAVVLNNAAAPAASQASDRGDLITAALQDGRVSRSAERAPLPNEAAAEKLVSGHMYVIETDRSEEHTSELQSLAYLVCRLLLEK